MSAIVLVVSPKDPVTWIGIDTANILKLLGFKTVILIGPNEDTLAGLPEGVAICRLPMSRVLNKPVGNLSVRILAFVLEQVSVAIQILGARVVTTDNYARRRYSNGITTLLF